MSDLLMDFATNDLMITNGDLSLATGDVAIQQDLQQRLQLWLGEWFLDTTKGVPYRQQILIKNPNMDVVQADITGTVTDTPGIEQILDINFSFNGPGRALTVVVSAQTSSGQVIQAQASVNTPINGTIEGTPT